MNKREIVHHRNSLLPPYPKEHVLRELVQLYSFTRLKVIQNSSEKHQNQSTDMYVIQKQLDKKDKELPKRISKNLDNKKIIQTERKNRKKILQDQKDKSPHKHHRDFVISREKTTKHSSRNLKY